MRCYVIATAIVFALIVVAHGARVVAEGPRILHEPMFMVTSALSLGLAIWGVILLTRPRS